MVESKIAEYKGSQRKECERKMEKYAREQRETLKEREEKGAYRSAKGG